VDGAPVRLAECCEHERNREQYGYKRGSLGREHTNTHTIESDMQTAHTNLDAATNKKHPQERQRRPLTAVLVWVVALFIVATANPFVRVGRGEDRCAAWSGREIAYYLPSAMKILETAAETPTYIVGELPAEMRGVAIWGHTFLEKDARVETLIHESTHQLQFRTEGHLAFAARYSSDMVRGLYAGCSIRESYLAVRYERQARDVAWHFPESIFSVLEERDGSTVEEELWMLRRIGPGQVVDEARRLVEGSDLDLNSTNTRLEASSASGSS
jgi:hypothetical protein